MRNANWHEVLGNAAVFKGSAEEFLEPQERQTRGSRGPRPDAPDKRGLTRDRWCANKGPAKKRADA
ncbi:MAG: hypothetical protein KBG84_00330 [Planctomycetes bacterium]|nr:hypothetical protein [Planctomycetota bacterium]CAG0957419.1 hypothetical protein PLCT2_00556 [Planctomycetaceae bacterium]